MGESKRRFDRLLSTGEGTDRLQFFSDAVFAIAITLLVVEITVPVLKDPTDGELWSALLGEWGRFFAYALSFAVIGTSWMGHHRRFRLIRRYDGGLIRINLLLLLLVAFVPFPTSLISEYGSLVPAAVSYAATVAAIGLVQMWTWAYAYRRRTDRGVGDARAVPLRGRHVGGHPRGVPALHPDRLPGRRILAAVVLDPQLAAGCDRRPLGTESARRSGSYPHFGDTLANRLTPAVQLP